MQTRINDTQPKVVYTLYRDGIEQSEAIGTGYTVDLSAARISGCYCVTAEYSCGIHSHKETLNSTTLTGDGNALLSFDRNWIFSQLHNDDNKSVCDIAYYNGLGYAQQEVQLGATEDGENDLIRPIVYDHLWRENRRYLPYARANGLGEFDSDAIANQKEFYRSKFSISDTEPYAYIENNYDAASDRILSTRKPGAEYREADRTVRYGYFGNASNTVRRLDIEPATGAMSVNGYYEANTLSCVKTTDEDGAVTIVYTDKEGRTIAEERLLRQPDYTVEPLITYYVYDDCNRLSWVITPKGYDLLQEGMQYGYMDEFAITQEAIHILLNETFIHRRENELRAGYIGSAGTVCLKESPESRELPESGLCRIMEKAVWRVAGSLWASITIVRRQRISFTQRTLLALDASRVT